MKLEIEIPDPAFQKGDVLQWNDLVLHIFEVTIGGRWHYNSNNNDLEVSCSNDYSYLVSVQAGHGIGCDIPIRPGTVLCFIGNHSIDDTGKVFSEHARKIEWDKPLVEADSMDTVAKRVAEWQALHPLA
tara:strand:- start:22 stop:408 length:387 start_codon:yes stop_codon:yes gene_type:complete